MKSIALAFFSCLWLLTLQVAGQTAKNEFPIVIEGVKCMAKAYKPTTPIIIEPMVDKDFRPKSQLMLAIMLKRSDISFYMSDAEVSECIEAKIDAKEIQLLRSSAKKMYELTSPTAEENPWKGMKYVVDRAFVVETEKGKFLVYQLGTQGAKKINSTLTSSLKYVDGKWMIGGEKGDEGQNFQRSMVNQFPAEFDKLHPASLVEHLPLEDLLK